MAKKKSKTVAKSPVEHDQNLTEAAEVAESLDAETPAEPFIVVPISNMYDEQRYGLLYGEASERPPSKYRSIHEILVESKSLKGISPECRMLPIYDEEALDRLCESIREFGQQKPIQVTPDRMVVDGRHRLIVCDYLGIKPKYEVVKQDTVMATVLSNMAQREYNPAMRAGMVLEFEKYIESSLRYKSTPAKKTLLRGRRLETDTELELRDGRTLSVKAGETVRELAIRQFGATESAVRRLVTLHKKDPALAREAIMGKITMRDAEKRLQSKGLSSKQAKSAANGSNSKEARGKDKSSMKRSPNSGATECSARSTL